MNDFIDRLLIGTALKIILGVVLAAISGCLPAGDASAAVSDTGWRYRIAIAAGAESHFQPSLPDGLRKQGSVEKAVAEANAPLVTVYTASWCLACRPIRAEVKDETEINWVFDEHPPKWVKSYPTIYWRGATRWWKMEHWPGLKPFMVRWRLSQQAPAQAVKPIATHGLYHGPYTQSVWSWEGDLRQHLSEEHGISMSVLVTMSDTAVIAQHDALHEGSSRHGRRSKHKDREHRGLFGVFAGIFTGKKK